MFTFPPEACIKLIQSRCRRKIKLKLIVVEMSFKTGGFAGKDLAEGWH